MNGDSAMRVFKFLIDDEGQITKDPPTPWHVGAPGNRIQICMVNRHAGVRHVVRLDRWRHDGKPLDPLTGTKVWQNFGGPTSESCSRHTVRDHKKYGTFTFDAKLDDVPFDPDLIVDPPPPRPPKKPTAAGAKTAAKQTKKKKAAAAAKSGTAKKAAGRAKPGKPAGKARKAAAKRR